MTACLHPHMMPLLDTVYRYLYSPFFHCVISSYGNPMALPAGYSKLGILKVTLFKEVSHLRGRFPGSSVQAIQIKEQKDQYGNGWTNSGGHQSTPYLLQNLSEQGVLYQPGFLRSEEEPELWVLAQAHPLCDAIAWKLCELVVDVKLQGSGNTWWSPSTRTLSIRGYTDGVVRPETYGGYSHSQVLEFFVSILCNNIKDSLLQ